MFGTTFGHGTLRKYVIYFGTLFNNLWVQRYDNSNSMVQRFKVPLNYGPRDKFLARVEGNPNLDQPVAITLPRMSFELTNMYYDPIRKLNTINKVKSVQAPGNPDRLPYQYQPVPYNFTFELSIMVKNAEDGTYIIEQILPYFTPEWTATLNLNPDLGLKYDVPVVIENITHEDQYEGEFTQRRALIWTITFTMKGYLFGPTKGLGPGSGAVIKEIDINTIVPPAYISPADASPMNTDPLVNVNITPGLTANGEPTTDPTKTIPYSQISADDNYGYIIDFTDFN